MSVLDTLREPGRPETLERFLVEWHGDAPRGDEPFGLMPEPLRRLYSLVEHRPGVFVQNQLLPAGELEPVDGKLLFYVENQGVYYWATGTDGDDAAVWGAASEHGPWEREEDPLSRFLVAAVLFEAIFAAEHGAAVAATQRDCLEALLRPLERLPLGAWRWPEWPTEFSANDGVAAVSNPNGPGYFDVVIAAREAEALAYLDPLADQCLDHFSRREEAP